MGCLNCRCKKNKINEEEYNELKEYLSKEIKDYRLIDYINEKNETDRFVEVEFEDYILELDNIDTKNLSLENIIDYIIKNKMI